MRVNGRLQGNGYPKQSVAYNWQTMDLTRIGTSLSKLHWSVANLVE